MSAQLNDNALRFFKFNQFPKVFPIDGFKIELVCNVKISRYGLRIAVHHDGFIPTFLDGKEAVYTAIIKFNTLAYPVWT